MSGPDYQKTRIYRWEDAFVGPRDPTVVAFPAAQAFVDAIWADQGLLHPPAVVRLSRRNTTAQAMADRLSVHIRDTCPSWVLLHELAHSMTTAHDGKGDGHGPRFMGVYARMLERYLRIPMAETVASLPGAMIGIDPGARPSFLDG